MIDANTNRVNLMNEDNEHLEDSYAEDQLLLPRRSTRTSYEEAIVQTGYGRFQYKLLALCGWALSSDAIEILSISFILPPATCDLKLTDSSKGWLNSAVFLGMMIGGYFWGIMADIQGRRAVLMWSLTVNALGGLASSFAQTFWLFLLLRIVSGIGVGGSMPVIFAYYTEFQSKAKRGPMITVLATFWMSGNIIAAALAWIVIPRDFEVTSPNFRYKTWQLYLALCVIPSFTSALLFILMPESPKFLMEHGKETEALAVLNNIHKDNHGKSNIDNSTYEVKKLDVHMSCEIKSYLVGSGVKARIKNFVSVYFNSTAILFQARLRYVTCTMIVIFFTLSFGYYGLFLWFPELFQRMEIYGGSPCHLGNTTIKKNSTSDPCEVDSSVYLNGFLTSISNLPGNIFTAVFIDRLGRKLLLSSSMIISGLSVFFLWFVKTNVHSLIMSCVFSGVSVVGWDVLDVLSAELFPTESRSTATGLLTGIGRIASILGNLLFGALITTHCAVPMLLVAVLLGGGGLMSLKLPNSANTDLI